MECYWNRPHWTANENPKDVASSRSDGLNKTLSLPSLKIFGLNRTEGVIIKSPPYFIYAHYDPLQFPINIIGPTWKLSPHSSSTVAGSQAYQWNLCAVHFFNFRNCQYLVFPVVNEQGCLINLLTKPSALEWTIKLKNRWLTSREFFRVLFSQSFFSPFILSTHQLAQSVKCVLKLSWKPFGTTTVFKYFPTTYRLFTISLHKVN